MKITTKDKQIEEECKAPGDKMIRPRYLKNRAQLLKDHKDRENEEIWESYVGIPGRKCC